MAGTQLVALGAAVASAACFGFSTSLQHLVSSRLHEHPPRQLLATLLRTPVWLLGILLSVVAFGLHAVALSRGSLVLVQPVIVTGVVFAVLVRASLDRRLPSRAEVTWAIVTWAGLALFLVGTGTTPHAAGSPTNAAPVVGGFLVAAVAAGLVARRRPSRSTGRGLWLGAVAGVLFGLVAVLLKLVVEVAATDPVATLTGWPLWALVGCGGSAVLVNQRAYQSTRLSVSMPLLNIVDVLVGLVGAAVVFGEAPRLGGPAVLAEAVGLLAMAAGVVRLARLEEEPDGGAPYPGRDHPGDACAELAEHR